MSRTARCIAVSVSARQMALLWIACTRSKPLHEITYREVWNMQLRDDESIGRIFLGGAGQL